MKVTRRGFLVSMTAAAAAPPESGRQWWLRPIRAFHPNMREADVRGMDTRQFVADAKALHADSLFASVGGIYAFYPSRVQYHYVSPLLEGRDFLKEITEFGHAAGLKIVARVDFSKAREAVFRDHPEWFARRRDGSPVAGRGFYETCPNSPYRNEAFAAKVVREILERYPVDGFHLNAGGFPGYCYCEECRRRFRRSSGADLPADADWSSPRWRQFMAWRSDANAEDFAFLHRAMLDVRKDVFWTGELAGLDDPGWMRNRGYDNVRLAGSCSSLMSTIDNLMPAPDLRWASSMTARYARSAGGRPPIINLKAHIRDGGWPRASVPAAEYAMWAWQAIANGAGLKMPIFGIPGKQEDQRNLAVISAVFRVLEEHSWVYEGSEPVAPFAMLWSQRTADMYGLDQPGPRYAEHFYGLYSALVESHLLSTVIGDDWLRPERLKPFRALVLPNAACLSDAEASAVAEFVRRGGGLVATYHTSLYDQHGARRARFALERVFGAAPEAGRNRCLAAEEQSIRGAYLYLRQPHEAAGAFRGTSILPFSGAVCRVRALDGAAAPLSLACHDNAGIPEEIDNPAPTSLPVLITNRFGQGRAAYFSAEVDRFYQQRRMADHRALLGGAALWALGAPPRIETNAPGTVEITLFEKPGWLFVHLVNAVGRTPLDQVVDVPDVQVSLAVEGIRKARAVTRGVDLPLRSAGDRTSFTLPRLGAYEVVALER